MHISEYILENETHKILWDFGIETVHQIQSRRPELELINEKKRTCHLVDFAVPVDHRMKIKEDEKVNKDPNLS